MSESEVEKIHDRGWIGVDLDGTLAEYHGWDGGKIGRPVPAMLARVKRWLEEGREVKIVTARVAPGPHAPLLSAADRIAMTRETYAAIDDWLIEHVGRTLEVTCVKDQRMVELWCDRAVQVQKNTGLTYFAPTDPLRDDPTAVSLVERLYGAVMAQPPAPIVIQCKDCPNVYAATEGGARDDRT